MYEIIKRPLITEKNTLRASSQNEYAFEVAREANKTQVKRAIEKLFNVKVVRVNTLLVRSDPKRLGKVAGGRRLWKKAFVKLKEGDKFEFVAG